VFDSVLLQEISVMYDLIWKCTEYKYAKKLIFSQLNLLHKAITAN